ncbi:hypothetical protein JIN84_18700 [Luteolibacter yonseiensis]|uniref:Uncharacterized protein n=1 Tax=Luteolibacter yonseiensis TaxID=1144680 RepID=A0A934VD47_9BACT|nr:hypothetical protein [Luteolibacter yonseiensis]MBK1817656.1 hypothetical protein [Luteolibacter yonseiensis]
MNRIIFAFTLILTSLATAQDNLRPSLETTYSAWREAMIRKDVSVWQRVTAESRRVEVRNRILAEKQPFPAAVFNLPSPPPSLQGLKFLEAKQKGPTAKASYFGKVDFGVGGDPTENLLVLSFIKGSGGWLYDRADFVNLTALATVRKELAAGNLKYLNETPEAQPSGVVPPTPIAAGPAKYIAKVYVFCPGREVKVQINKISAHRFANAKEAEVVIGGAKEGSNEIQYAITKLEGGTGKEAMTIRVYLMSEVEGTQPIKAFEYQLAEGDKLKSYGTETFTLDAATISKLTGN